VTVLRHGTRVGAASDPLHSGRLIGDHGAGEEVLTLLADDGLLLTLPRGSAVVLREPDPPTVPTHHNPYQPAARTSLSPRPRRQGPWHRPWYLRGAE